MVPILEILRYYPFGAACVSSNRIFAMHHASTPQHIKELVLSSITQTMGIVHVVFAAVALGMGVDLKDTSNHSL